MVKFDMIRESSFWGLSLWTLVSIGTARAKGLSAPGKLARPSDSCGKKVAKKQVSFAERPVSFVSSGTMGETVAEAVATAGDVSFEKVVGSNSKLGTFETHTKGFGSKMMAKMGSIEGTGLGKEGQGMLQAACPGNSASQISWVRCGI